MGGCHTSPGRFRSLVFLLQALRAEKCSLRVVAAPMPGWARTGDSVDLVLGCISLCSGCLPAELCRLHYPEEPQGFSGVNSMPVGSRKCLTLNAL